MERARPRGAPTAPGTTIGRTTSACRRGATGAPARSRRECFEHRDPQDVSNTLVCKICPHSTACGRTTARGKPVVLSDLRHTERVGERSGERRG
eukprot:7391995-Prymnesium_polylepis.1